MNNRNATPVVLTPEVTTTTPLLITADQFSAGAIGVMSSEFTRDGMRQWDGVSTKVTASRGVSGEYLILSIEPVSNPSHRHPHYVTGALPVTVMTVAVRGTYGAPSADDVVTYLSADGINTAGAYVKNDGTTVSKKGAGYGLTVANASDPDTLSDVIVAILRASIGAPYGRPVADRLPWLPRVATWNHDLRFINGGEVTGASKVTYRR